MIEHALRYAQLGWAVFPCDPRNKAPHPILGRDGGFKHATLNADQIRAWWQEAPDALIGSAASFAVDIDTPEGIDTAGRIGLRAGAIVRTGNGWHAHFAPIDRLRCRGTIAGLTIRPVNRAYVIMPPSRHPDGATYRWLQPDEPPRLGALPKLPRAALDLIAPALPPVTHRSPRIQPRGANGTITDGLRGHIDRVIQRVRDTPPGKRHPTAVAAAIHLARLEREHGLTPGSLRPDLENAALKCGLDAEEVIGNEWRRGLASWAWEEAA